MKQLPVSVFHQYPAVDTAAVSALLTAELSRSRTKLVVLDDDPTGVQTVHDVSVYTDWSLESIRSGFAEDKRAFYILTNSRGMTVEETTAVHRDIGQRVCQAAREAGTPFLLMSRGDSTLRGHYPLETELLRDALIADGQAVDGEILCPFFREGGRFTIDSVHYVRQGEHLVPAAETEFAKDKTFGYTHSFLPDYIEEKTGGAYKADGVTRILLDDLRHCRYEKITDQLLAVRNFGKICVDAIDYCDIQVFAVALYRALDQGRKFLFRTAAGLVKVLAGISDRPLLTHDELIPAQQRDCGGVIVVGSHTQKTSAQLQELLKLEGMVPIEFNSDLVLDGDEAFDAEVARCIAAEETVIRSGKTAVCFTRRKLLEIPNDTKESALVRSVKISDGVQRLVGHLGVTPAFVIAKGGITSSDVGVKALQVRRANVLGQIRPGIPVWQLGSESRFPRIPYVIFPGNVGEVSTLREAAEILTGKA